MLNLILGSITILAALGYAMTVIITKERRAAEDARKQRMIDEFNMTSRS